MFMSIQRTFLPYISGYTIASQVPNVMKVSSSAKCGIKLNQHSVFINETPYKKNEAAIFFIHQYVNIFMFYSIAKI